VNPPHRTIAAKRMPWRSMSIPGHMLKRDQGHRRAPGLLDIGAPSAGAGYARDGGQQSHPDVKGSSLRQSGRSYGRTMDTPEQKRSAAALELADALLAEFDDPSSSIKGIGGVTMTKLLAYQKIVEKALRRQAKRPAP